MSSDGINISLTPEPIANFSLFGLGNFDLTNSMFSTLIITILLCIFAISASGMIKKSGKIHVLIWTELILSQNQK